MDDTSSNATSVGVRLIRRRSQFSRRRLLSKNAAPFIHCLYLIYARKFDARENYATVEINPDPHYNIINRTGLAEMRGPVLWLQHTSSTPDTSTRRPVCPQCFRAHLHPVVSIKLEQRQLWPCKIFLWLCRYYQLKLCTKGRGQQCLEFLTSVFAVECTRM